MPNDDGLPTASELYVHALKTIKDLRAEVEQLQTHVERLKCEYDPDSDGAKLSELEQWQEEVAKVADKAFDLDGCCHWEPVCEGIEKQAAEIEQLRSTVSALAR